MSDSNKKDTLKKSDTSIDISKVKSLREMKRDPKTDKISDQTISVTASKTVGFRTAGRKKVRLSTLINNPVETIKRFPTLAKYTNVTKTQLEFIQKTPVQELKKLIENGK